MSKAYGIINRFSEDIDISLDKDPSASEKKNIKLLIEDESKKLGLLLNNSIDVKSRYDYNRYVFSFKSLFTEVPQEIIIETSFYQTVYPVEKHIVTSLIGKFCNDNSIDFPIKCDSLSFEMTIQSLQRTFIDKVFAICDYYLENKSERNSRHLYDICKMLKHIKFDESFNELVNIVRKDRMKSKNNPSAKSEYNINVLLNEIIEKRFYEKDYNKLTSNLLYEEIDYSLAINNGIKKVIQTNSFSSLS